MTDMCNTHRIGTMQFGPVGRKGCAVYIHHEMRDAITENMYVNV